MPQHKSAAKRVRQDAQRRARNRVHRTKMRTMMKKLQQTTDTNEAELQLAKVKALLDRMASKGLVHKNKAANYKRQLDKHANRLREG